MQILVDNVRSFSSEQWIPLRPLTLLVGENSSGKSTILAIVSALLNASRFWLSPGFNEPPYNLGTFDTIATFRTGRNGRAKAFRIGFSEGEKGATSDRQAVATYVSDFGNPALRHFRTSGASGALDLTLAGSAASGKLTLLGGAGGEAEEFEFREEIGEQASLDHHVFARQIDLITSAAMLSTDAPSVRQAMLRVRQAVARAVIFGASEAPYSDCVSLAPIRSKPERTYDVLMRDYSPEGDHVPTVLARLFRQEPASPDRSRVAEAVARFGERSGLFRGISIKQLGKLAGDPFQVEVDMAGSSVNLIDVGYGISQALPVIVQSVLRPGKRAILVQQPEIHLHPRAQAALGSFFAELCENSENMFLVETHSDYLVDRIRQEIAAGKLSHEKVLILFLHNPKRDTAVYPITIDSHGNVEDAPPEYRSFFLQEGLNLLSRAQR